MVATEVWQSPVEEMSSAALIAPSKRPRSREKGGEARPGETTSLPSSATALRFHLFMQLVPSLDHVRGEPGLCRLEGLWLGEETPSSNKSGVCQYSEETPAHNKEQSKGGEQSWPGQSHLLGVCPDAVTVTGYCTSLHSGFPESKHSGTMWCPIRSPHRGF
jgi:hypothetical protein